MRSLARALAVFATISCGPNAPPTTPSAPSASTAKEPEIGEAPAIVQARVGVGARGASPSTWIDFEVQGPGAAALRVCRAMVDAQLRVALPDLVASVRRPCSTDALAEPEATSAYALVQIEHPNGVELATLAANDDVSRVTVRRRSLSGYHDEQSCNEVLAKIAAKRAEAAQRNADDVAQFLDKQIDEEKKRVAEACAGGASDRCKQARAILELLEKKKQEVAQRPAGAESATRDASAFCRRR